MHILNVDAECKFDSHSMHVFTLVKRSILSFYVFQWVSFLFSFPFSLCASFGRFESSIVHTIFTIVVYQKFKIKKGRLRNHRHCVYCSYIHLFFLFHFLLLLPFYTMHVNRFRLLWCSFGELTCYKWHRTDCALKTNNIKKKIKIQKLNDDRE